MLMHKLAAEIQNSDNITENLTASVQTLAKQLNSYSGRKNYKYLPKHIKKTVDDIFEQLTANETIRGMYKLWCDIEQQKHDVYSSAKVAFLPMAQNKAFSSVRNMIIKTISEMGAFGDIDSTMNSSVSCPLQGRLPYRVW